MTIYNKPNPSTLESKLPDFTKIDQTANKSNNKDLLKKITYISAAVFLLISAIATCAFLSLPFNLVAVPIALTGLVCLALACKIHFRGIKSLHSGEDERIQEIKQNSFSPLTYSPDCDWNDITKLASQHNKALSVLIQDSVVFHCNLIWELNERGYKVILEPKNPNKKKMEADYIEGRIIVNNCKLRLEKNLPNNMKEIEYKDYKFYISNEFSFEQRENREIDTLIARNHEIYNEEFICDLNLFNLFPTLCVFEGVSVQTFNYFPQFNAFLTVRGSLTIPSTEEDRRGRYIKIGETKLFVPLPNTYFPENQKEIYRLRDEKEVVEDSKNRNPRCLLLNKMVCDKEDEQRHRLKLEQLLL